MNNEIEGVEDDALSGLLRMNSLKPTTNDFVLGVTASGLTSFVWGSMFAAYRAGCCTGLLSFNPHIIPRFRLQHLIRFDCGPEILTGSTRLKCGTISKVVLNMISTASMVQLGTFRILSFYENPLLFQFSWYLGQSGKCMSNLMTDVQPTNAKLKQRLANILVDLAKDDPSIPQSINSHEAHQLLIQHNYKIRSAIQQLRSESSIKFRD